MKKYLGGTQDFVAQSAVVKESQSSSELALAADHQHCCLTGKDQQTQFLNRPKESSSPKPEARFSGSADHTTSVETILPDDYRFESAS